MKILYYAHQHGSGHCKNAEHFKNVIGSDLFIATSSEYKFKTSEQVYKIPPEHEVDEELLDGREMLPDYLHYSPVANPNIIERSFKLLEICYKNKIELAIIDLSVEVASLMRASSIPFAYVRLPGNRNDLAHTECYKAATFLFAYYPKELEDTNTPQWVVDKTIYFGYLFSQQSEIYLDKIPEEILKHKTHLISAIKGFGGSSEIDEAIPKLKAKYKDHYFLSIGPLDEEYRNYYDYVIDYTSEVYTYMKVSKAIIAPASLNISAEILSANKPYIVVPSWRHFDEQEVMAKNLIRCGYATSKEDDIQSPKQFKTEGKADIILNKLKNFDSVKSFYKYIYES